jgi:hypothetical protein
MYNCFERNPFKQLSLFMPFPQRTVALVWGCQLGLIWTSEMDKTIKQDKFALSHFCENDENLI